MIFRQKARNQFYDWYWNPNVTAVFVPNVWLSPFDGYQKKNSRHTTPPQTHISFIIPRPKGIGCFHKNGTGNNKGRQLTTPHDFRCSNLKDSHSKSNKLSSPVISVSPPLNNSVINPPKLSSVGQQSSRSSHNTPRDNRRFNKKDSNSKSNEFSSPVIPVTPPLNDLVINITQM